MLEEERVQIRDARKRCFFMVDNVIIDHYASIIGPFPTLVYAALCRHADYSTRETHPSHDFLAKELKISRATVKRSISMLIQHHLIARKHRKSKSGDPDTNIYIILEVMGGVSQTLPPKAEMLSLGNINEGVGSVGTGVGSVGTEGGVSQNPGVGSVGTGVGSVGATNNTQLQDSIEQEKDSTTLVPSSSATTPTTGDSSKPSHRPTPKSQQPGELHPNTVAAILSMVVEPFHCLAKPTKTNEKFWDAQIKLIQKIGVIDFQGCLNSVDAYYAATPQKCPIDEKAARARMNYGIKYAIQEAQKTISRRSHYAN